jgi:hypothetical protein
MTDAMATLDLVLKIGNLVIMLGGGGMIVWRMSRMATRFELIGDAQAKEITEIKNEVTAMRVLMTAVAVQKERLDSQGERLNLLDRRYEELRHGEGFIYPLGSHLGKRGE